MRTELCCGLAVMGAAPPLPISVSCLASTLANDCDGVSDVLHRKAGRGLSVDPHPPGTEIHCNRQVGLEPLITSKWRRRNRRSRTEFERVIECILDERRSFEVMVVCDFGAYRLEIYIRRSAKAAFIPAPLLNCVRLPWRRARERSARHGFVFRIEQAIELRTAGVHAARELGLGDILPLHRRIKLSDKYALDSACGNAIVDPSCLRKSSKDAPILPIFLVAGFVMLLPFYA